MSLLPEGSGPAIAKYRLHYLALPSVAQAANLSFVEDFSVVAGQTANGILVLPTCSDVQYLVPAGVEGIPYVPQLGHKGGRVDYQFPQPVVAILVLTTSTQNPTPQATYTAPGAAVSTLFTVASDGITTNDPSAEVLQYEYHFKVTWSPENSQLPARIAFKPNLLRPYGGPPIVGKTWEELQQLGFYADAVAGDIGMHL
ncbi:hypothetical protein [Hymenobacter cheonanensis]|uniref:hypothetical protein n=1 Tax=Hymenobacter sp. CA2-7 TaxID=3063993 RepID=UPI0027125821|nr:hypothetical protein [Hymenobacter sp. CA2-7]MDO7886840.1 hypothetical protein [Hymenobacter sp. CA2-7]